MASVRIFFRMVVAGSMGANITSSGMNTRSVDNIGLEFIYTGTAATGTWSFEGSNDSTDGSNGNWFTYTPAAPPANPSASSGATVGCDVNQYPYGWLRVKYTRTSGTGTLDLVAIGKEI